MTGLRGQQKRYIKTVVPAASRRGAIDFAYDDETHTYTLDGVKVPSVTEIAGLVDREYFANEYSEIGKLIHKLCAHVDMGSYSDGMTDDEDVKAKVRGWIKFKDDTGFEPTFIEKPMCHAHYNYAGTPDRAGILRKIPKSRTHESVVEIKSFGVRPTVALQLVGYERLFTYNYGYWHMDRYVVQLLPDDYKLKKFRGPSDWPAFYALLQGLRWKYTHP